MAFDIRTIDEELSELLDTFDANIAPKRVWRNNNNKLYLIFRSIAAGFAKIREVVLGSKYRFDPLFCSDDDLDSAMRITGEVRIPAKPSIVRITAFNTDMEDSAILRAGEYSYISAGGQQFLYTLFSDTTIPPNDFTLFLFVSKDNGSFLVEGEANAAVTRTDAGFISDFFRFEAVANADSLGRAAETHQEIRERLLTDTKRQDSIRELELAINALPTIFSCNLIFNPSSSDEAILEDGTAIAPKHLLIVLTGVPGQDLAELVMAKTVYSTQMVEPSNKLIYENSLFAGGSYPVFFTYHARVRFYLAIYYTFDSELLKQEEVEARLNQSLMGYRTMTQHIDEVTEPLIYDSLKAADVPGAKVKKVYLQVMKDGQLDTAITVPVPKLALAELVDVTFIGEEV